MMLTFFRRIRSMTIRVVVIMLVLGLPLIAIAGVGDVASLSRRDQVVRVSFVALMASTIGLIGRAHRWDLATNADRHDGLRPGTNGAGSPVIGHSGSTLCASSRGSLRLVGSSPRFAAARLQAQQPAPTTMLDLAAFDRAPLAKDPFEFVFVERFVRPMFLEELVAGFPRIAEAGSVDADEASCGRLFRALLHELHGPAVAASFSKKFGIDLDPLPRQIGVRRRAARSDGRIHNDSRSKFVTAIIYFNRTWETDDGCLRLLRDSRDIENYALQVPPIQGNLIAFKRSERSYHGFRPYSGERLSLQMYWVDLNRFRHGGPKHSWTAVRAVKRLFKSG